MATAPTYCTHRQLKDVFPQVDSFDNKRALYGWVQESALDDYSGTSNLNIWYSYNTGLITQLFIDGGKATKLSLSSGSTLSGAESDGDFTWGVASESKFGQYDIIKCDNQYGMIAAAPSGAGLVMTNVANASLFNTQSVDHDSGATVYIAVDESEYDSGDTYFFLYDSDLDLCILSMPSDSNPNDSLVEAGEDFSTLITRITGNASRYLDAKLDPNLPREQLKDKEGNFDYIIVRTTALIAAVFLIRSHDPTSEVATALMEDAMGNIDALNKGGAALSWQTTGDSSKGIVRDVTYTSGSIRPVDTRGRWSGSWDLLKVKIITGGELGTATYSVWTKDSDDLKNNQVITEEKINGDYQVLAGGLQIRFGGSADDSVATANNEWEIEVAGWQEEVDNSAINSVRMTRR
jgi:hypothetical protein